MFKDNKLRLLMTLVGFIRLGATDDPDASWIIPSSLTSAELLEAISLIRKFEFDPPIYEDGKAPEDLVRSKATAARRSARRAEFDDDSDSIDGDSEEDRGEYALDDPTTRKPDSERKRLKRRRRARTPVELNDEERNAKAEARRRKEIEKQAKTKSNGMQTRMQRSLHASKRCARTLWSSSRIHLCLALLSLRYRRKYCLRKGKRTKHLGPVREGSHHRNAKQGPSMIATMKRIWEMLPV